MRAQKQNTAFRKKHKPFLRCRSMKCCITLSKPFLRKFKSLKCVETPLFCIKKCLIFPLKAGDLYAYEDAKQRTILNGLIGVFATASCS